MWMNIVTIACIIAYIVEIYFFCRGLAKKSFKEMINYVRGFNKIKYLAVYLTTYPLIYIGLVYDGKGPIHSLYFSISRMLNLVVLKFEFTDIDKLMGDNPLYKWAVYGAFLLIAFTAAIFTISLVIQQLWVNKQKKLAYKTTENKLYIFGNNSQNVAIYNSDSKRSKFIIDDISDADGEKFYLNRVSFISTKALEKQLRDILHKVTKLDKEYVFVVNTDDEEMNIRLCNAVIDEIRSSSEEVQKMLFLTLKVFVFGDPKYQAIYEDIISSGYGCIHYVNKYQKIAVDFVDRYPLAKFMDDSQVDYSTSLVKKDVDINVALIGFGKTNQQIFLTSVANNQFLTEGDGDPVLKPVKYFIFDKDLAENNKNLNHSYYRYKHECKDVDPDKYLPLPSIPAEENYLHLDINNKDFYNEIRAIVTKNPKDANFIVIAFGSDLENLDMAQKLVEKRSEWNLDNLVIFVKVRRWHKEQTLLDDKGCYFIGNENDCVYDIEKIIGSKLYKMAQMRNETYDLEYSVTHEQNKDLINEEYFVKSFKQSYEQWYKGKSQMERDSSIYSCLSLRSKLNLMGLDYCLAEGNENIPEVDEAEYLKIYAGDDMPVDAGYSFTINGKKIMQYGLVFDKSLRRNMAIHEHQRWNSFMISRGMIPSSRDQILNEKILVKGRLKNSNGKNYAVRRHGNLTTFEGLVEFRKMITDRDGSSELENDVIKYDYQILDDAYWLLSKNGYKIIKKRNVE
ncbi:MAG: hypothetical protein IKW53_04525 [Clostridia bacterium]|nr:hypothetical protein [Clostridia bacterium]